jgi:hypothetical protein
MRRRLSFILLLIITPALQLSAQTTKIARGAHTYEVRGTGQGAIMEPWLVQVTVRDTLIGNKPSVLMHVGSRLAGDAWRFNWWMTFNDVPPQEMHTRYAGRSRMAESSCNSRTADKMIEVLDHGSSLRVGPFDAPIVAEHAVSHVLSGMQLEENRKLELRVYRCEDAHASEPVRTWNLQAVVTTGEHVRTAAAPLEKVWIVKGDANYPYIAMIAQSDRMVLRFEIPQGSDSMVGEYRGTRPAK